MLKEPTPEMNTALQAFADKYERRWKTELITRWMNGRDDDEPQGHLLRSVRNNLGPTWLMDKCDHIKPAPKAKKRCPPPATVPTVKGTTMSDDDETMRSLAVEVCLTCAGQMCARSSPASASR